MSIETSDAPQRKPARLSGAELEAWYANNPPATGHATWSLSGRLVNWVLRRLCYRGTWQLAALVVVGWILWYDLSPRNEELRVSWGALLGFYLVAGTGPCWGRSLVVLVGGILLAAPPFFDEPTWHRTAELPLYVAELIGIASLSTLAAVAILQGLTNWGRFRIRFSLATVAQVTAAACIAMALLQPFLEFADLDSFDDLRFLVLIPILSVITPVMLLPPLLKTDAPRYRVWGLCLPVALMIFPILCAVWDLAPLNTISQLLIGLNVTLFVHLKTWLLVGLLHFGLGLFGLRLISAGNADAEGAGRAEVER